MSEEVTVEVTITERVKYSKRVKMRRSEFDTLDKGLEILHGKELRRHEEKIGEICDRQDDWQDADDLEIENFGIVSDKATPD